MNELDRQRVLHLAHRRVPRSARLCIPQHKRLTLYRVLLLLGLAAGAAAWIA